MFVNTSGELFSGPIGSQMSSGFATASLNVPIEDLIKSFTDDPVAPSDPVTLEFTIVNLDRVFSATDIEFSDDLGVTLTGLMLTSVLSNDCAGTVSGVGTTMLDFSGGNLPAGGSCTLRVALSIPSGATPGDYTNTSRTFGASDSTFVDELTDAILISGLPTGGFLPFPVTVTLPPLPDSPCGLGSSLILGFVGDDREGLFLTGGSLVADEMCTFDVTLSLPASLANGTYVNTTGVITVTIDGETLEGDPASDDLEVVAAPSLFKEFTDNLVFGMEAALAGLEATGLPLSACGGILAAGISGPTLVTFSGGSVPADTLCSFDVTLDVPGGAADGTLYQYD